MSDQSTDFNNENEIGKKKTEITVELVEEKDIPEVLDLLKEFFFKVKWNYELMPTESIEQCLNMRIVHASMWHGLQMTFHFVAVDVTLTQLQVQWEAHTWFAKVVWESACIFTNRIPPIRSHQLHDYYFYSNAAIFDYIFIITSMNTRRDDSIFETA